MVTFERPGTCPQCGADARLEHIDIVHRRSTNSCPCCRLTWTLQEQIDGTAVPAPW